jgi:hypothetical protein
MQFSIGTNASILFMLLITSSCDYINPSERIPSYIQIDSILLEHEESLGISDAWVYVNTELIGVFELPATIPVLTEGMADIMISGGIKVNGMSSSRTFYPFYESYRVSKELKSAEVITINPTIGYDNALAQIPWKENFDEGAIKFEHDTTIKYGFIKDSQAPIEGNFCGLIEMDSSTNLFYEVSVDEIAKPENITQGYFLEMNFKSDIVFNLTLIINNKSEIVQIPLVEFNPTKEWKKIYLDLYATLSAYPTGTKFKVSLNNYNYATNSALEQSLVLNPKIWIDDIKIVQ